MAFRSEETPVFVAMPRINVISAVPQGSVLAPLLFIIFVNTVDAGVTSTMLKFADDAKVFRVIRSARDQHAFHSDFDKLVQWLEKWQMEFNLPNARHCIPVALKIGGNITRMATNLKELPRKRT